MNQDQRYISFDIEASGRTPGRYSMLSLGACPADDTSTTFYAELQPISSGFIGKSMEIGCLGLRCLEAHREDPTCNPLHVDFVPTRVLEILQEKGEKPADVMERYANWIKSITGGQEPVELAAPIRFDSMWTTWYFDNFYNQTNPFGYTGGMDIGPLYKGVMRDMNASFTRAFRTGEHTHNALDDAIQQAEEFQKVLQALHTSR